MAFPSPLRAATLRTLRRLTRMAATALVLVVGLNGLTAPVEGPPARPTGTVDVSVTAVAWAPTAASAADFPTRSPRATSTAPATGVPSRHADPDVASSPTDAAPAVSAGDPGRASVARRGPPSA